MSFKERHVDWSRFVGETRSLGRNWIFRGGLRDAELATTLERASRAWNIPPNRVPTAELLAMRDFQRHPEGRRLGLAPNDHLGWFATMQHYGAPSRLLDWSYSPFVAAYFAVDALFLDQLFGMSSGGDTPERAAKVWALNTDWLRDEALRRVLSRREFRLCEDEKNPESFASLYLRSKGRRPFVAPATPFTLHRRLSRQQGTFLCPGDVSRSWMENLNALRPGNDERHTCSFVLSRSSMPEAFEALGKMNVTARTLFPGLAGYAKSMNHRLKLLLDLDRRGTR